MAYMPDIGQTELRVPVAWKFQNERFESNMENPKEMCRFQILSPQSIFVIKR